MKLCHFENQASPARKTWIKRLCVLAVVLGLACSLAVGQTTSAQQSGSPKLHKYDVVVLPPDGGADSYFAGYLSFAPLTNRGTAGLIGDMSTPGYNSYNWMDGKQVDLQPLPQLPDLTGTATYNNWINESGFSAGYGTRTDSVTGASLDHAAIWTPDGQVFPLSTPEDYQSHGVWINDYGQVSGWIANSTSDCFPPVGLETQGVVWQFGFRRPLGTLGGKNSYGEFTNDLSQVSGHSETSTTPNSVTGCPPFDPFLWENGTMIDINPGNFGGAEGGTNFLNNHGQAVGFGTLQGEQVVHPFLWSNKKLTDLYYVGNLGGALNSAYALNERGDVVGVASTSEGLLFAVMWKNGEFVNLMTLSGFDCSVPVTINSQDQIVGESFSCETGASHAFLWENNEMVDLNEFIPSDLGIELIVANWVNESGAIAAQGVLTSTGAYRAVLLIPNGECDADDQVKSSAREGIKPQTNSNVESTGTKSLRLTDSSGRLNPMFFRPFSPAKNNSKSQQ